MGNCCSNNKNKGLGNDEDQAMEELGQLLKLQAGAEDAELSKVQLGFRCRSIRSPAKEAHIPQIRGKQMGAGLHIPTFHTHSTFITAHEISKGKETYLGRTETKLRDNHPQFLKTLTVCYEFQQVQEIKFELFDDMAGHQQSQFLGQLGGRGRTVHAQEPELLGTCTVKLVDIINGSPFIAKFEKMIVSRNRTTGEEIEKVHHAAQLIITHEEVVKTEGPQYEVVMDVSCRQLEAKNFFGAGYTRQTLATLLANLHQDLELINDNNRGKEVLTVHGHEPYEPTNFTQVLSKAYRSVSTNKDSYLIVLIVTDGQCSDFQQTIDMIVEASTEPISILIIGVGDGPFEKMEQLSADDRPLKSSTKQIMQRDIVGFVPFREYRNSPEDLARETLKEIPRQFTSWAKKNKITPEDAKKDKVPEAVVNPDLTHAALLRNTNDVEDEAKSADESDVETKSWESYSDDETGRRPCAKDVGRAGIRFLTHRVD
ncbi:Copine-D [Diplonema papillatum]|nr:Copine-D [Diplonema papillatum]